MQSLKSILWAMRRTFRSSHFFWYHVKNFGNGNILGIRKPVALSAHQKAAVHALKHNGIFITDLEALLGAEASRWMEDLEAAVVHQRRAGVSVIKPYLIELVQDAYTECDTVFARFALQQCLTDLAKAYFGMSVKLCYFDAWVNLPWDPPPTHSQLWHRDPEDRKTLKMFLYLVDVDEHNGAFSYVPNTHRAGRLGRANPDILNRSGGNTRSSDEHIEKLVPRSQWIRCMGKKGTLIMADTSGFHKGGHCTERERVLFTCTFTSLASTSKNCLSNIVIPR